jgi:UDP-sulfoquinovose synthase
VLELAKMTQAAAREFDLDVKIQHVPNPRVEAEEHYYNAAHTKLLDLGLQPHLLSESLIDSLLGIAIEHKDRIDHSVIQPRINWRNALNDMTEHAGSSGPETKHHDGAASPALMSVKH